MKVTQYGNECASLDGTRMDQIRFDFPGQTSKVQGQTRHIPPAEFALSALPNDLLNVFRDWSIFRLAFVRFQLQKQDFMLRLR